MANGNSETTSTTSPPMVSFKTVSNTLADFKAKGVIPPTIDKRLWPNFSNTVSTQLVATMKFLGLIDEAGVPTQMLRLLVEHHGGDEWASALELAIRTAYAPVMDVELDKVHGSHLRDKFKEAFGVEGDPQRKAIAFFLFAARDAGMKLSPYLKLRERGPSRGGPRKKREKSEGAGADGHAREEKLTPPGGSLSDIEIKDVTAEAMTRILKSKPPKKVQDAVLTIILYLTMGNDAFPEGGS